MQHTVVSSRINTNNASDDGLQNSIQTASVFNLSVSQLSLTNVENVPALLWRE